MSENTEIPERDSFFKMTLDFTTIYSFVTFSLMTFGYVQAVSLKDCSMKLEPIGCFADNVEQRTLPELIINERNQIDWKNYERFLADFICRCATKAFAKGYKVIGVQYYAECWSAPDGHNSYDEIASVQSCVNGKFKEHDGNLNKCDVATGMDSTNFVYRIAPTECNTQYKPVGCYKDAQKVPRPMVNYLINERDYSLQNWNGHLIAWRNWNKYSPEMICRCAEKARIEGHEVFAIQFWGECWSSPYNLTSLHARDGPSDRCRAQDFDTCPCNSYHCVGMSYANHVYVLMYGENEDGNIPS